MTSNALDTIDKFYTQTPKLEPFKNAIEDLQKVEKSLSLNVEFASIFHTPLKNLVKSRLLKVGDYKIWEWYTYHYMIT